MRQYYTRAPFADERTHYKGALTSFLDFLTPLAAAAQQLDGLPSVPLFVMLDDADNLPKEMQRVLNSWVSSRSTPAICLKITTQLAYATLKTLDNRIIESPHDFAEVNLSAVYTSEHDNYSDRVRQIVSKRLANAGLADDVHVFFPPHEKQARRLTEIAEQIAAEHAARTADSSSRNRRGATRPRDEQIRYAVPRYMRELAGPSRSGHTYSYAGFKSLVDVSSGVVRWFLEPASRMYDRMISQQNSRVTVVPVGVQDDIIKEWSTEYVEALLPRVNEENSNEDETDRLSDAEASLHAIGHETAMYVRLRNLIEGLGRLFRERLLDEKSSEQRVISVVLRDTPAPDSRTCSRSGYVLGISNDRIMPQRRRAAALHPRPPAWPLLSIGRIGVCGAFIRDLRRLGTGAL